MILDRAPADAEFRGDNLAGLPGDDPLHDLALPHGQPGEMAGRILPPPKQRPDQQILFAQQGLCPGEFLAQPPLRQRACVARDPGRGVRCLDRRGARRVMSRRHGVSLLLRGFRETVERNGGNGRGALIHVNQCPVADISALPLRRCRITHPQSAVARDMHPAGGRGVCLRNTGCARFRPLVGGAVMMEHPDIIQMNVDRYRAMLDAPLDDETRARVEQLLGEATYQLGHATDLEHL
jgi:hypothetical protein